MQEGLLPERLNGLRRKIGRFASAAMLAHLATMPVDSNGGLFASSSGNFIALFQPFDLTTKGVTLEFGSYFRIQHMATDFEHVTVVTPQHIPDILVATRDDELLTHMAQLCSSDSRETERIFRSLDWVRFAFTNSTEHSFEARIVSMATAFEILLDIPVEGKTENFSKLLNALLPTNHLPVSTRPVQGKGKKKKTADENDIGWWCRHFYDLRSRIVHGEKLLPGDWLTNGSDDLKIALSLFVECIWGLLLKLVVVPKFDGLDFWIRARWIDMLGLPHSAFY